MKKVELSSSILNIKLLTAEKTTAKNRQRINSIKTCDTLQVKTENQFLIR